MSNWSSFELLNLCEIQFYIDHFSPCQLFDGWPWELLLLIYGWRYGWKMPKVKFIFYGFIYLFLKKVLCFQDTLYRRKQQEKTGSQKKYLSLGPDEFWTASGYIKKHSTTSVHIQVFVIVLYWLPEKFHYSWMLMEFSLSSFFISCYYFYTLLVHSTWFDYIYLLLQLFPNSSQLEVHDRIYLIVFLKSGYFEIL